MNVRYNPCFSSPLPFRSTLAENVRVKGEDKLAKHKQLFFLIVIFYLSHPISIHSIHSIHIPPPPYRTREGTLLGSDVTLRLAGVFGIV